MKFISARSRSAPAPFRRVNLADAIFAPRLKSSMSSSSPISQCGFGLKVNCGGSPHRRTSTFDVSSGPTGTDGSGTFGMSSMRSRSLESTSRTSASRSFIRPEMLFMPVTSSDVSSPALRIAAILSLASLRSCLRSSTSASRRRRSESAASAPSTSATSAFIPRLAIAFLTSSGSSLISLMSSISLPGFLASKVHFIILAKGVRSKNWNFDYGRSNSTLWT